MPNLVKQRFVVSNNNQARVINSNIRLEELYKSMDIKSGGNEIPPEFEEGIFATKIELSEDMEEITGEESVNTKDGIPATPVIEEATETASQILERAREEAEQILNEAKQTAQTIKGNAYNEGFANGDAKAAEKLQQAELQLKYDFAQKEQKLMEEYTVKMEQLEPDMVSAFLHIIREVLTIDMVDYAGIISELVTRTILHMDNPKSVSIYVSPDNFKQVKELEGDLIKELGNGAQVEVLRDDRLEIQQCKIETERGIYDCGLDTQMNNLFSRMKALSIRS